MATATLTRPRKTIAYSTAASTTKRLTALVRQYAISKHSAGYSENTINRVSLTMQMLSRDMHINTIDEMTTETLLLWGDMKRNGDFGRPISQSGLYANYNSIRSFLKFLDDIDVDYPANRRLIYCKPNYTRMVCLRPEEVKKISRAAPYDISVLIRLLYTAGMRLGEGLSITSDDLRHDNTIFINGKWCKSRTVFITGDLKYELERLAPDGGYCFRDKHGEPMDRKKAYWYIKQAMIRAGYPNAYPHSLRHGFTTTLLREGANLSQVQRLLGHTHIQTTQRYEHLVTDDLAAAHSKFLIKV